MVMEALHVSLEVAAEKIPISRPDNQEVRGRQFDPPTPLYKFQLVLRFYSM